MNKDRQEAVIEAVLFSMGSCVKISRLAELIEATPKEVRDIVEKMRKKMESANRGITITEIDEAYQMCSKPEMYEYLLSPAQHLSAAHHLTKESSFFHIRKKHTFRNR